MLNEHYPTPAAAPIQSTMPERIAFQFKMFVPNVRRQLRCLRGRLLLSVMAPLAAVLLVLLINRVWQVPVGVLMRDVFAVAGQPVYIGLISNLGILLWAAAATIWAVCWFVLRGNAETRRAARFCFWSFWFSLFLLLDDALMFHDELLPVFFGAREGVVIVGMGVIALAYGLRFGWQIITETAFVPELLAAGFLASSLLYDKIIPFSEMQTLVEDGLKLAGIVFWLSYTLSVFDRLWHTQR